MIIEQQKTSYAWGHETVWTDSDNCKASFVGIKSGQSIYDKSRTLNKETVYVLYGTLVVELKDQNKEVKKGQAFHIEKGTERKFLAPYGDVDLAMVSE